MSNFWQDLPKPFLVLAPMEGVTDVVFREIIAETAKPDVLFTEFTSADGIISAGKKETTKRLQFTQKQRPIIAQIWGTKPENIYKAAGLLRKLKFDGVDLNMGCPDKVVMKMGAGAAHIKNPTLAKEIIQAAKDGAKDIPVSVKTRIGYNSKNIEEWFPFLLEQNINALTIHGRISTQKSKGEADWDAIRKVVEYRNTLAPDTVIIGNGDVLSFKEAETLHKTYKVDGVMVGRGIFQNPWIFERNTHVHTAKEYQNLLKKHLDLFDKTWGKSKNFEIMKKYFKIYIRDFGGASQLRQNLMECNSTVEVMDLLNIQ